MKKLMGKDALQVCDKATLDITTTAELIEEWISDLETVALADVGAQLKRCKAALDKADQVIKARIIDEATDGKIQGAHFTASVVEAVRWTLDSAAIKQAMGAGWCERHSKQGFSRSVRYGI